MEKPIIFRTDMVKAILDGRKTQTRRIIKPQPGLARFVKTNHPKQAIQTVDGYLPDKEDDGRFSGYLEPGSPAGIEQYSPYQVGDKLWVREVFNDWDGTYYRNPKYKATNENYPNGVWKSPYHMTKTIARLWLEVTNVKVERLQDISLEDILAEGIEYDNELGRGHLREKFRELWDSLNAKRGFGWDTNPYVFVYTFRRLK